MPHPCVRAGRKVSVRSTVLSIRIIKKGRPRVMQDDSFYDYTSYFVSCVGARSLLRGVGGVMMWSGDVVGHITVSHSELELQTGPQSKPNLKPVADGANQVWKPGIWVRLARAGVLCRFFLCPFLEIKNYIFLIVSLC